MNSPARRPSIGVFDSGFGGLTVLRELVALNPDADYLYFGDTARLPYGSKSVETVARYAVEATYFLERQGAHLLVIACNTATALALDQITRAAQVPVVGVVEPGAEQASAASKNRRVVVIGTEATVSSHAYLKALEASWDRGAREGLPAVCSAGRGRLGRACSDRTGGADLSSGSLRRRISRCGRARAGVHALSVNPDAATASGAGARDDCRLGALDGECCVAADWGSR